MRVKRSKNVEKEGSYPDNVINLLELNLENGISAEQIAGYEEAVSALAERKQIILKKYFDDKMTLRAIGEEFSLQPERIRQIWYDATRELRRPHNKKLIILGPDTYFELLEYQRMCALNDDLMVELDPAELPVEKLNFNYGALKAFKAEGIETVGELLKVIKEPLYYYDWIHYRKREHNNVIRVLKEAKILPFNYIDPNKSVK